MRPFTSHFSSTHAGRYGEAFHYYSGSYDILRGHNPAVDKNDCVTLFKRGCTANGLTCLWIGRVLAEEEASPAEFRFMVEFINYDGTVFVLGPYCGATE